MTPEEALRRAGENQRLKNVTLTAYKRDGITHLDPECPVILDIWAEPKETNFTGVADHLQNYCKGCLITGGYAGATVRGVINYSTRHEETSALIEKAKKKPSLENVKAIYENWQTEKGEKAAAPELRDWVVMQGLEFEILLGDVITENRSALERELEKSLGLESGGEQKLLVKMTAKDLLLDHCGDLPQWVGFILTKLYYRATAQGKFLILPDAYKKHFKMMAHQELGTLGAKEMETMEKLMKDGGVYADPREAAAAARELS